MKRIIVYLNGVSVWCPQHLLSLMRLPFSRLLGLFCFILAGSGMPTGWAAEPAIDRVALARKALYLPAFRQVADAFARL